MRKKTERVPQGHRLIVNWRDDLPLSTCMHKYGGIPSNGAVIPACEGCGGRFHLLFQIDLADPNLDYLELTDWDYLFVITCLNCASYEKPMYYRFKDRGQEIEILQENPGLCVREYPDPLGEHNVLCRHLGNNEYPLTNDVLDRLLNQDGKHQLGGIPIWVQRKERILCIACDEDMEYIAMIDSELHVGRDGFRERGHMFGDEGILYVFVCRQCSVFAVKAQSF